MEHLRSTRAEINLDNLKHNIGVLRRELGPDVEPMAIIKADCYGHGAVIMMEYMMKYGLRYFGVASLNEDDLDEDTRLATMDVPGEVQP